MIAVIQLRFSDIRRFCDRTARISICMQETLDYENFNNIRQVPYNYDSYFLYGIGVIDGDFKDAEGEVDFLRCLEIVLPKEPRQDLMKAGKDG